MRGVVPRRARIQGSYTCASLNSRLKGNQGEEGEDSNREGSLLGIREALDISEDESPSVPELVREVAVRLWGLGFGVWGLGFEVWGLGFGIWDFWCGVWGVGSGV